MVGAGFALALSPDRIFRAFGTTCYALACQPRKLPYIHSRVSSRHAMPGRDPSTVAMAAAVMGDIETLESLYEHGAPLVPAGTLLKQQMACAR